jgi:hypothetical protein
VPVTAREKALPCASGPYAEVVKKAYVEVLGYRVTGMIATDEERALYFKLVGP